MCGPVDDHILGDIGDGVDDSLALRQFESLLAVIAETHGLADIPLAGILLNKPLQHLDERRFSHAVLSYDADLLIACERIGEIIEYHLVAETFADPFCLKYL